MTPSNSMMRLHPSTLLRVALGLMALCTLALPFATVESQAIALGTISIPSLAVQAPIVHVPMGYPTWDLSGLGDAVGTLDGTGGWPGQSGNFVLAGHSSIGDRPSIFANLPALQVGQEIDVYLGDGMHRYVVAVTGLVDDDAVSVVMPSADARLTLITCDEPSFNGVTYTRRFVVVAVPVS